MPKKIYFSPSDQTRNTYAVGDTTEAIQCRQIALYAADAAQRCGFDAMTNITLGGDDGMVERVRESNAWGADVHIPIHTNAADGKIMGTRIFTHDTTGAGYRIAQAIMAELAPITPGSSDSITAHQYYEVTAANAPTVYLEVGFHDNAEEAQWIIDHKQEIAEAIVRGLCNYYGVTYIAPEEQEESEMRFNTIEEVPGYAKETIQKLVDNGLLSGKKDGSLDLSEDMIRMLVINDRAGLYD